MLNKFHDLVMLYLFNIKLTIVMKTYIKDKLFLYNVIL